VSTKPRVGIVVLNWNNTQDTLECLASVVASDYPDINPIVVDNGSDDFPELLIRQRFPAVQIARQRFNRGYAGGNNIGIELALRADAEFVMLLNNDAVLAPDALGRLVDAATRHVNAGFLTPRILVHGTDSIYWDGGIVDWSTGDGEHDSSRLHAVEPRILESAWSNGCAPLVRAKTIADIGLMDESLFLYYEDVDWSARATRHGWKHLVVLDAVCWHKVSRSTGGPHSPLWFFYVARNRYRVLREHNEYYRSYRGILRYATRLLRDYYAYRRDREIRRAIVEGAVALVRKRRGPRQPLGGRTLTVLDAILVVTARSLSALKALKAALLTLRPKSN
jgi:hypothetical protein